MITIKNCLLTAFATVISFSALLAQPNETQPDFLASTGKIYVVVAVLGIIFLGILILLISLERRLAKIEKEDKEL
jgi:uncharacterized membrane protein